MFYLGAIGLLAAGALVVLFSLLRKPAGSGAQGDGARGAGARGADAPGEGGPGSEPDRKATMAALYQDRLDELRGEMAGGNVPEEERQVLEAELGRALLADVDAGREPAEDATTGTGNDARPQPRAGALAVASALLLLAVSVLVYSIVGDPQAMDLAGAESVFQLDASEDRAALDAWRERLARRVDTKPDDAKSWYLLGHVDMRLARFNSAAEAFAMAHEAHGDDPSIDIFWLQSRYMAAGGVLDATSRTIAERVLAGNPNQPLVLEMYAIDAFRRASYEESVSLLNRALSNPMDGNHRHSLEAGFNQAREQLGVLPGSVDVEIQVDAEVPPGMTLFVIARPVGGGMPFAVVRRPADRFPRTVRLDDAVSMNPAAPLSGAGEVEIVVRLSRSGTAMAHPGDWEWTSEPLNGVLDTGPRELSAVLSPPA